MPIDDPFSAAESRAEYPTPAQRRVLWTALAALATVSLLAVASLTFYGFITFLAWSYPILMPIGLAVIIALVLEPIVDFVQKRGANREVATLTVCLLAVVAFLIFWAFLLPPLVRQAGEFFKTLPALIDSGVNKLDTELSGPEIPPDATTATNPSLLPGATNKLTLAEPPSITATTSTANLQLSPTPADANAPSSSHQMLLAWIKKNLPSMEDAVQKNIASVAYSALGPVGQLFGFVLGFGFVPIYVYYFLSDQEQINNHWHELVPMRQLKLRDEVIAVMTDVNKSLVSYFRGQIIVAACNGVLTFIGLWIIGIPYSLVLGIITGALSIVPFLGIICSIIPALLLGFISAKNDPTLQWLRPVLVLGVFGIVQMTESMFITPRVQSHSTGLHPLAIILGILFWSALLPGLLGPIVAVPLTCAGVVLLRRYVWQVRPASVIVTQ